MIEEDNIIVIMYDVEEINNIDRRRSLTISLLKVIGCSIVCVPPDITTVPLLLSLKGREAY